MNEKNPEQAPKPMLPTVAAELGIGIPKNTSLWIWPKKPLSPFPKDGAGATSPQFAKASRPGQRQASTRISRGTGKGKPVKKRLGSVNNFE